MPKAKQKVETPTLASIKRANAAEGGHWFEPAAMRFFHSRIEPAIHAGPGGVYFVTSEAMNDDSPRRYSVRKAVEGGRSIETLGGFQAHGTAEEARAAARKAAAGKAGKSMEACCAGSKVAHEGKARAAKPPKRAKTPAKPKTARKRKAATKRPAPAPTVPKRPAAPPPQQVDTAPERRATAALREMVSALNRAGQVATCEEAWAALMDAQRHRETARRHLLSIPKSLVPRAERLVRTLKDADRHAAKLVKLIGWCQTGEGRAA